MSLPPLKPGDVDYDGSIVLVGGGLARSGRVWVSEDQAVKAAVCGWRQIAAWGRLIMVTRESPLWKRKLPAAGEEA